MAKVGLKDTLALLAKGYSKKEIDALAAVDEENEKNQVVPSEPPKEPEPAPANPPAVAPAPVQDDKTEPDSIPEDLKKQMEDLQAKLKESEEKLKKLQQNNVHANSAGAADDAKNKEQNALTDLVRSFM